MASSVAKKLKPVVDRVCLVACGSFNPPTIMHIRMLEQCRDRLTQEGFEVTGGILSPVGDGYKKKGLLPAKHRVKMCEAAASESTWIKCDPWEANQEQHILTRVVLERFSTFVDGTVMLACGADLLQSMLTPGVWAPEDLEVILGRFGLVCLERSDQANLHETLKLELFQRHISRIHVVPQPVVNNVSSTIVRSLVKSLSSIRYLVPPTVELYIKQHDLYKEPQSNI